MNWLNSHHLTVGGASVSYAALLVALLVVMAGFLMASKVSSRIRNFGGDAGAGLRWRAVAAQVVGYALRFAAVAVGLQVTGIDIASVVAAGAVLAVGIGIAMQKVAENFVSGIILFAERSIREGDVIEFDGRIAKVRHMGVRATIALTLDDEEIIVPNSILAQSAVKNLTLTEPLYRLRVRRSVSPTRPTSIERPRYCSRRLRQLPGERPTARRSCSCSNSLVLDRLRGERLDPRRVGRPGRPIGPAQALVARAS
ncbi:MAG: mechanosensitive ion channel [Polyangiaceae bacterium]|nr:mechanosensitive ion channel [Polyangiaceae bacterium]